MRELLIATKNMGKYPEMIAHLAGVPFTLINLKDLGETSDVEETAMTFEGNAIIKAVTYGKRTDKLTLADDSGLEVDALGGAPGIMTARYAPGTDTDRYEKLLEALKDVPDENRGAQFRSVVAIYDPLSDKIRTTDGMCRGRILHDAKGDFGFGFDPVFFSDELGKRFGEVPMEGKASVDHRGRAIEKMKPILLKEFV